MNIPKAIRRKFFLCDTVTQLVSKNAEVLNYLPYTSEKQRSDRKSHITLADLLAPEGDFLLFEVSPVFFINENQIQVVLH